MSAAIVADDLGCADGNGTGGIEMSKRKTFSVGDRVKYSRDWCRSFGIYTGDIPFARGVVTETKTLGDNQLCTIDWGNPEVPARVMACNLHLAGKPEIE